jgi:hypothetical protein
MKKKNGFLLAAIGITLAVCLSPILHGIEKVDKNKILSDSAWNVNYIDHFVDETFVDTLRTKVGENLKIDVYLGLWCSDSKNHVPPFIKIIETIGNPKLEVNYYTVERKASKDIKYFVEEFKVERVPTFIFYRDGKEIGRIVENPKNSLIEDFLEIVF